MADPSAVRVECDGQEHTRWRPSAQDSVELELDVGPHELRILTGHRAP